MKVSWRKSAVSFPIRDNARKHLVTSEYNNFYSVSLNLHSDFLYLPIRPTETLPRSISPQK